ncbi:3'-5' exonuclease [Desulfogranum mediterraneum]|uniref:3'-5' exonuclease n=1 Tax=Desulfogranum mediterraneum TaxID=160661 RepID=UPI00041DC5B7|nr:3'-5' exonuclease [Desulfogranum mediterraneum]
MSNHAVIVLDFETTGLSPRHGDRAIEIGAVRLENGEIVDRFQSLMNPGFAISSFISSYTGISNAQLASAPPCAEVMARFGRFIADLPLVAHNANFDRKFLVAELERLGTTPTNPMACSMLTARRIFPQAPNHKLGTLVHYCDIATDGTFHRALADAEMTGHLWLRILDEIRSRYKIAELNFSLMQQLATVAKAKIPAFLDKVARRQQPGPDQLGPPA